MKKQILIPVIIVTALVVLAMSWWLVSPLFLNKTVNEQLPGESSVSGNVEYEGTFVDADNFHKTSGTAKVVTIEGKGYVSLESFQTTNGPDLYVYLSTSKDSSDVVSLGKLKGNRGNQNYEVPNGVDLRKYNTVIIWCKAFSALFGSAELK